MPFLLLFLLALTCLQANWPAPAWSAAHAAWLTWGGTGLLVAWAAFLVWRLGSPMAAHPERRPMVMRRFNRLRRQQMLALLLFHVFALYVLGWGWLAQRLVGTAASSKTPELFPGVQL